MKRDGKRDSIQIGGAGGLEKRYVYVLRDFELHIGDKRATFNDINISTQAPYANQKYYGNLGQDLISQFPEMIVNFENMYVEFR